MFSFSSLKSQKGESIAVYILSLALIFAIYRAVTTPLSDAKFTPYGSDKYSPTESVEILNSPPQYAFKEIGEITADGAEDSKILAKITKKAKEVGADAVIIRNVVRSKSYDKYETIAIKRK